MAKLNELVEIESLQNETSAIQILNQNSDSITAGFQNTISRDGSTPNSMQANLDLGLYRLINLGAPVAPTDAVRKTDLDQATGSLDDDLIEAILALPDLVDEATDARDDAVQAAIDASNYIGAATSAGKWTTARTLTLGGVLSGSQSFDGSANFTLSASYVDGSVTSAKLAGGAAVANIGYTPANKAGDTLTGDLILLHNPASLNQYSAGFRGTPVTTQDATYTLVLSDSGKMLRHTSGSAHTWTIPPNSSVAYPVGTVFLFRNVGAGAVTIGQGSGVSIRLAGASATGNKTLAQWGYVSLEQEATDNWVITGVGVT